MYTSQKTDIYKTCFRYVHCSLFVALFGAIYESFSHQVFSGYMIYAFAIPLALGAVPTLWLAKSAKPGPSGFSCCLYHCGIATLTVGCIFQGVLEIYGTTNRLILVYPIAGGLLTVGGIVTALLHSRKCHTNHNFINIPCQKQNI